VSGGGNPDQFWRSTPREVLAFLEGVQLRLEREHQARAWLAWHIAALPRAKRLPKLEDLLGKREQAVKRPKSSAEIEALVRRWLGGERAASS